MNWAWPTSLDQLWRSPTFPMWLTLAAAGFFALIVLITLLRAEKSVANGALTVITLLAIGIAVAATIRGFAPGGASRDTQPSQPITAALPALSCVDDLAGETILAACEKFLFGSADAAAAAVSYAAARLTQLTSFGDVPTANKNMTPELSTLRRSVERDRYGLMAYVLSARDRCQPGECAAYRLLTDHNQIAANMDERIYEGLISRYSAAWNAPVAPAAPVAAAVAAFPTTMPTGKPTNAEFPSAASTPPVNIMTPEPTTAIAPAAPRPPPAAANAQTPTPAPRPSPAPTAAKKQAAPKARAAAPVQLSPAPAAPTPAPAPTND
jgi:hypothetical protein